MAGMLAAAEPSERWRIVEEDGRMEVFDRGALRLGWQLRPLVSPVGGSRFAASAFLHPLRTPAGFEWTRIQPDDHKHHLGLWWPWKYIEVEGVRYNTWEIQDGEGAQRAEKVIRLADSPGGPCWEFHNQTVINRPGQDPRVVIEEVARVRMIMAGDAQVLDISLRQKAVGPPVKVVQYRYSGFSWRGPAAWNSGNSVMITSEGKGRDEANGSAARWVLVKGPADRGEATVLLMGGGTRPSKLRVWDSKSHGGTPFVNFNPVQDRDQPLDDAHPEVSNRRYRVIAADRAMSEAEAEAEWRKWAATK